MSGAWVWADTTGSAKSLSSVPFRPDAKALESGVRTLAFQALVPVDTSRSEALAPIPVIACRFTAMYWLSLIFWPFCCGLIILFGVIRVVFDAVIVCSQ